MKKDLKRIRSALKSVIVGHDSGSFDAGITDDLRSLVVHDVPSHVVTKLCNSDATVFDANVEYYESCTMIVGKMAATRNVYNRIDVVGHIECVFHGWSPVELDSFRVETVYVKTPFVGSEKPHVSVVDMGKLYENVSLNLPITFQPKLCDIIEHEDWWNSPSWNFKNGIKFDGMVTAMPVGARGLEAIRLVRERVEALLVLLTLLNGGYRVSVDGIQVGIDGQKEPDDMLFPIRSFDIPEFGRFFGHRLRCDEGLRSIGMEGVMKWLEWHSRFRNKAIVDRWILSKDGLNSISVLEGVGRALLREDDVRGDIYFKQAVGEIVTTFDLKDLVSEAQIGELNDVNNKLVKHLGDLTEEEESEYRQRAGPSTELASVLVGYAISTWALGKLPATWNDSWRHAIARLSQDSQS